MTTADFYTFYVLILGIPDGVFWGCDYAFVKDVADNLSAYNGWKGYAEAKARDEARRNASHK